MQKAPTVLLIILLSALAACEADVSAPRDMEDPFSMYGILNPRLSVQTIGVAPIEPLLYDFPETIDVLLQTTNLETGETIIWRDSVVPGEPGQIDHVFTAEFMPAFGSSYRVEAIRSDGAATSAVARVPELVEVTTRTDDQGELEILVLGDEISLLDAEVTYSARIVYWLEPKPCEPTAASVSMSFSYRRRGVETGNGFRVPINMERDHNDMELELAVHPANDLALLGMRVRLLIGDADWDPPGGVFDANVLAHPDVMTNTTNGFGLVAGGYNHERSVYPSEEAVAATRFQDFIVRPPGDCVNYCDCGVAAGREGDPLF